MQNNKGFTLVELMITLALSGIIMAAVYSVYTLQQKTYTAQDQVVEMQQNIRAATLTMVQELRMAGYDPTGSGDPTIEEAKADLVYFTANLDNDDSLDGTGEHVAFDLYTDSNGVSVLGITRSNAPIVIDANNEATGHQPIAENIEAIEFLYTLADGTKTTAPGDPSDIRTITISILARAAWQDSKFVNTTVYEQASKTASPPVSPTVPTWDLGPGPGIAVGDSYRRRLLITTVQCRNMGL